MSPEKITIWLPGCNKPLIS